MEQGELFAQAMKRPKKYAWMSASQQYEIDKKLGILDWDGSCPHSKGCPCAECEAKYFKRMYPHPHRRHDYV